MRDDMGRALAASLLAIGRWEGDTLVVDTIGMREESWLDTQDGEKRPPHAGAVRGQRTIIGRRGAGRAGSGTQEAADVSEVSRAYWSLDAWSLDADPLKTLRPFASVNVPPNAFGNPFLAGDEFVSVTASPIFRSFFLQPSR